MNLDLAFYETALAAIEDGAYFVDKDRRILHWNKAAERLTGYKSEEVIGSKCQDEILMHVDEAGNNLCQGTCPLARCMDLSTHEDHVIFLRHKNGHRLPVRVVARPVIGQDGEVLGAVEVFSAQMFKNEMMKRIAKLEKQALLDPLTRLVNRRHLEASLQTRLDEQKRFGWQFGVLFIDVDHFKEINDRFGHDHGDKVLRLVAMTLSNSIRPFDLVGRWGGEEFVSLLVNINAEQLLHIANRARALVSASVLRIGAAEISVTISIGATMAGVGDTPDSLVRRADRLMYASKGKGRNRVSDDIVDQSGG